MPVWPHVIEILNFHFPTTFKQLVPLPEEGMACYYLTKIFYYSGLHIFFSFELPGTCTIPVIGNGGQKICTYSTEKNALLNVVPWLTWIQRSLRMITTLFCGSHWNAFCKSGMTLVSSWLPMVGLLSVSDAWCLQSQITLLGGGFPVYYCSGLALSMLKDGVWHIYLLCSVEVIIFKIPWLI